MITARFVAIAAITLASTTAFGHFIWLEIPPGETPTAHMRFAEAPLEATDAKLQDLCAPMHVTGPDGKAIVFEGTEDKRVAPIEAATELLTGTLDYGIMDRTKSGGDIYMLKYHAKGSRDPEAAAQTTALTVDIRATIVNGTLRVGVFFHGKPAPDAELVLDLPNQSEQVKSTTDEQGFATFPVESGGWVGVRAMVPEVASGRHEDKSYDKVRHYGTLTFPYTTL